MVGWGIQSSPEEDESSHLKDLSAPGQRRNPEVWTGLERTATELQVTKRPPAGRSGEAAKEAIGREMWVPGTGGRRYLSCLYRSSGV